MKIVNLLIFVLLINVVVFGYDNSDEKVINDGIFYSGSNHTLITWQYISDLKSDDSDVQVNFIFNHGFRINPNLKITVLAPGILWEPKKFNLGDNLYYGTYLGITGYSYNILDKIHYYSVGLTNQIGLKVGDTYKLTLNIPFEINYNTETIHTYNEHYKYNTISSQLTIEKLIDDYTSFSLYNNLFYYFTLAEELRVNNSYLVSHGFKINFRNSVFFNLGCEYFLDAVDDRFLVAIRIEGRI